MIVGRIIAQDGREDSLFSGSELTIADGDRVIATVVIENMFWEQYWAPENDRHSNRKDVIYMDDALTYLKECKRVVDLGCGTGHTLDRLAKAGIEGVGVTYQRREYEEGIAAGRNIALGDIHKTTLPDHSFDGFICWDVIEHTMAPLAVLCEARRIVKDGGKGLIFVPGTKWQDTPYHIVVPTIRQMKHLLQLSGWNIVELVDLSDDRNDRENDEGMAIYKVQAA